MYSRRMNGISLKVLLAGLLIIGLYALVYWVKPLSSLANQFVLGTLTLVASALASIYATKIYRLHLPGDAPRSVWMNFAIGFWLWTIAEFLWLLHGLAVRQVGGTASGLTISHAFWFVAYFFFSIALYRQYKIIASPGHARGPWIVVLLWGIVLFFTWITMLATSEHMTLLTFAQYFFGFADLAVGTVGLTMLLAFSGGALAWPWWGFVGLAISNIIYELLDASMMATLPPFTLALLELFSELTYIGAYLVLAFGFYRYYSLLRYGPRVKISSPSSST